MRKIEQYKGAENEIGAIGNENHQSIFFVAISDKHEKNNNQANHSAT